MRYSKVFLIILTLGLVSCSEEFLETTPTEFISADRMSEVGPYNDEIFNGVLQGVYSLMVQTGTGGTDLDHDDFGQKSYDIYSDMLSGDMVLAGYNYGWYRNVATMVATEDYTDIANYKVWRYYYRIIFAANSIIDGLGGNDVVPESESEKHQMGQAKAMRAYGYFFLANFFATEYDESAEILPLYTSIAQPSQPLSTGAEVWGQIKSDLEEASSLLDGFVRDAKFEVDASVAKGLLAYTYLTMGDYSSAAATATDVINNSGYTIIPMSGVLPDENNPRGAFSYIDNADAMGSWMWGMDLTLDQGLDLVSWYGQVDVFTYSYAAVGDPKTMDMGLYNSISDDDSRKYWFGDHPWYGLPNCPFNKFYHEGRTMFTQREVTSDYVYMRIEEMYLILAEAAANLGNDSGAQSALFALVEQRHLSPEYVNSLTGDALKDEIYKQWRIEMWGEGKSYLALKRFKKSVVREGHIDLNGIEIPYNDDRLTFEIPYQEIQDNPHISL